MFVGSSFVVLGSGFTFWVRRSGAGLLVLVRRSIFLLKAEATVRA
jgi:hypothetical protein